jgi:hypothetical protein
VKLDCTKMTWCEMRDVVRALVIEMKRRNPIGINLYTGPLYSAYAGLDEIAKAERVHRTAEHGPGIDKKPCPTCNGDGKLIASTGKKRHPLKAVKCPTCEGRKEKP